MKNSAAFLCFLFWAAGVSGQGRDTFEVYFPFNKAVITKDAQDYIDRLVFNDTLIHGDKLILLGYTDYVGGNGHNDTLSRIRARNIQGYLGTMGFDKNDITYCVGKGKISRAPAGDKGYAADRKVQIIIDHTKPTTAMAAVPLRAMPRVKPVPRPAFNPVKPMEIPPQPAEKIEIADLAVNETFALNNIFFEPGSPIMLPQSDPDLQKLLALLNDNPSVNIRIEGHVCCVGPVEGTDERNLSYYRAVTVFNYLVDNGISKDRLSSIGMGNRNPVVKNEITEEDRVKNRRVEIRIMSK